LYWYLYNVKKYSTVFFDLDHTLWDFERNSGEALTDIFEDLRLHNYCIPAPEPFIQNYKEHNHRCWEQYRKGEITKDDLRTVRFELALKDFDIVDPHLAMVIGDEYVSRSPYKRHLFPGTVEVLEHLYESYQLLIITNGFEEVQHIKINESGLKKYFNTIITSERAGVKKPHPDIFHLALQEAKTVPESAIMIGDDAEADVAAAIAIGIDGILFDPHKKNTGGNFKVIHDLYELKNLL